MERPGVRDRLLERRRSILSELQLSMPAGFPAVLRQPAGIVNAHGVATGHVDYVGARQGEKAAARSQVAELQPEATAGTVDGNEPVVGISLQLDVREPDFCRRRRRV